MLQSGSTYFTRGSFGHAIHHGLIDDRVRIRLCGLPQNIMVGFVAARKFGFGLSSLLATSTTTQKSALLAAKEKVDDLLRSKQCGPILVRLAWHDSGTFDVNLDKDWPGAGGAIGSIRFEPEILHGANAGLVNAIQLLEPIQAETKVSFADLFQLASARAIALAGGPVIPMKYGRVDASKKEFCSPEGNLPDGNPNPETGKYGGPGGTASTEDTTPNGHLRKVFYRMGLSDEEIVALSGAHTFGRAYKDRSGEGKAETKYTNGAPQKLANGETTTSYTPGGSSWTPEFLVFDNSYFQITKENKNTDDLVSLSTDKAVFADDDFRPFAERFRESQHDFFESYSKAHKKLSELGSLFDPPEGITLDE